MAGSSGGGVGSEELVQLVARAGGEMEEEEARALVRRADRDGDGVVSYQADIIQLPYYVGRPRHKQSLGCKYPLSNAGVFPDLETGGGTERENC